MSCLNYILLLIVVVSGSANLSNNKCYAAATTSATTTQTSIEFDKLEIKPLNQVSKDNQYQFIDFFVSTLDEAYKKANFKS